MKIFFTALFWLFMIYFSFVVAMFMVQRDLMYFPSVLKLFAEDTGIIGLEEINVTTADGLELYGWLKKPDTPDYPLIVWFHGNASNIGWSAIRAKPYLNEGYGALFVEYRGYAGNPGMPMEEGFYNDGRAFMTWLKDAGYKENQIIAYGESIGSGPAVKVAQEYPGLRALVLETPFTSTVDVAARAYPLIPVEWLMQDRYDNIERIASIQSPLIIVHGTADRIIPYELGEKLFNAANEPKIMISIDGGDHNNLDDYGIAGKIINALNNMGDKQ